MMLFAFVAALVMPSEANAIVFINEKAPGVRQVINPKTGEKEWRNSNGDFLGKVSDSLPLADLDKYNYAYDSKDQELDGYHNVVVDPMKNGIKKVWDPERKCYVWRDRTGNYLGRVPDFPKEEQWINDEMNEIWQSQNLTPAAAKRYEETLRKLNKSAADEFEQINVDNLGEQEYSEEEIDAQINNAESNINEGEAAIDDALKALHELGMHEYDGVLKGGKSELGKARNATKSAKKKR